MTTRCLKESVTVSLRSLCLCVWFRWNAVFLLSLHVIWLLSDAFWGLCTVIVVFSGSMLITLCLVGKLSRLRSDTTEHGVLFVLCVALLMWGFFMVGPVRCLFWVTVANSACHLFILWLLYCICLSFPLMLVSWCGFYCIRSWVILFALKYYSVIKANIHYYESIYLPLTSVLKDKARMRPSGSTH